MDQRLDAAFSIAETAHAEQKYGEHPYSKHLGDVVRVLKRFGVTDVELLCAGALHDTIEDTTVTQFQIEAALGRRVADLVFRVTNEPGVNRKARHALTYPKIAASDDAITLKLADRIANTEHCVLEGSDQLKMYKKEYKDFKAALYKAGTHDAMWRHLDFITGSEE